jgi:hypothetical protein
MDGFLSSTDPLGPGPRRNRDPGPITRPQTLTTSTRLLGLTARRWLLPPSHPRCTGRPVPRGPSAPPLRYGRDPTPGPGLGWRPSPSSSRRGARPRPSRRDPRHRHSDKTGPSRPDPDSDGIRVTPGNVAQAPTGPSPPRHLPGLGRQPRTSPVPRHRGHANCGRPEGPLWQVRGTCRRSNHVNLT